MLKETDKLKFCILCSVELNDITWEKSQRKNYINKCRECIKSEKRAYQKAWRLKHPEQSAIVSNRYKNNLRKIDPVKSRSRDSYNDSRKRAISNGMQFDLTPQFVHELMTKTKVCPYFEWPLTYDIGKAKTLASLDRIDSSFGYTKSNVRVISYLANLMKSYATEDELIAFAKGILKEHTR